MTKLSVAFVAGLAVGAAAITADAQAPHKGGGYPAHVPHVVGAQGRDVVVTSRVPGTPAVFPLAEPTPPSSISIRRHGGLSTDPIWQITSRVVQLPNTHGRLGSAKMVNGVGFDVPQLPQGIYDAWYVGGQPAVPSKPMTPTVGPAHPSASQSITFEIRPRLRAPEALIRGTVGADVEVAVGFLGPNSIPGSTASTAKSFDPVPITLGGLGTVATLSQGQGATAATRADGLAHFHVHVASAGQVDLVASSPGFQSARVRVLSGAAVAARMDLLQIGDVLLHVGEGFVSDEIVDLDGAETGTNPQQATTYSHAGLYAGKDSQGRDATIEMLSAGWTMRPLADSIRGDLSVDVYRRPGATPTQGQQIVANAVGYNTNVNGLGYAYGQIAGLGAAYYDSFAFTVRGVADYEDIFDEGKERMICSELVAWAYLDAGLGLRVVPWPSVQSDGLLITLQRQVDYTTPNMLAHSPDLQFQFHLKV